ncbi:MAG: family 20 glycosylhydrolase [Lentisphaeria bacterium]|nr:family 20 glycosylhydrolase [Lentisphaeria bacterium]
MRSPALLLAAALASAPFAMAADLLRNGSFESPGADGLPAGWQAEIRAGAEGRFELVPEARDGRLALQILHTNESREWVRASQQPLKVRPETLCRVSGWVKATGSWTVLLYEFVTDGSYRTHPIAAGTATDWQRLTRNVQTGPDATWLKLSLITAGRGEAWFDGFHVDDLQRPPRLRVPRLAAAPPLDGEFTDPAWENALSVEDFLLLNGGGQAPSQALRVRIGMAGERLFVGWECGEERMADLRLAEPPSWNDDTVELFLMEPGHDTVFQFGVTPNGGCLRQRHQPERGLGFATDWFSTRTTKPDTPAAELPGVTCAARKGPTGWSAVMCIDLGGRLDGPPWRAQFARSRKLADTEENSTWALTPGERFRVPECFGHLALSPPLGAGAGDTAAVAAPDFEPPRSARIVPAPRRLEWLDAPPLALASPVAVGKTAEGAGLGEALLRRILSERFGLEVGAGGAGPRVVLRRDPLPLPEGLADWQRAEAYALDVDATSVRITAEGGRGFLYGVQTLGQVAIEHGGTLFVPRARILDWPELRWRGWHLIGPETSAAVADARRVVDLLAALKLNWIAIQIDSRLRYERDPRLSRGPDTPTKAELRSLVDHARSLGMEVIPMTQCWSHFSTFLSKDAFRHLAEVQQPAENASRKYWNYCPRHPETHTMLFGMIAEQLECFPDATMFHVGLDEITFEPIGQCERCRNAGGGELLAEEIGRLHDFLKSRGLRLAMWGDQLLVDHNGKYFQTAEALPKVPRDVVIFDWHYHAADAFPSVGFFREQGFEVVASGWYEPLNVTGLSAEAHRNGVLGYGGTTWFAIDRIRSEIRLLTGMVLTGEATWRRAPLDLAALPYRPAEVFQDLWERPRPASAFRPIDLGPTLNRRLTDLPERPGWMGLGPNHDLRAFPSGRQWFAGVPFDIPGADRAQCLMLAADGDPEGRFPDDAWQIPVGVRAEALVFLHTCSRPERFSRHIYDRSKVNPGPIGAYVVHYEDGTTHELPLQWNVNLADWNSQLGSACGRTAWLGTTAAGALARMETLTWRNPLPGKTIRALDVVSARSTVRPVLLGLTAALP